MVRKGSSNNKSVGWWAFIVGLVLAVIFGFAGNFGLNWILILLGLVVGFLNIGAKDTVTFLIATVAFVIVGSAGLDNLWAPLAGIFSSVVAFVAPAALVVALKAIYETAQSP